MHHPRPRLIALALAAGGLLAVSAQANESAVDTNPEARFLSNVRQLTFEGTRGGEGYFSRDGTKLVFQSEREKDNPFYQIYLMDLETGDTHRVSPGHGKTTCAWIHPDGKRVMFASTHDDKDARKKQKDELDFRASGKQRRYSWDFDANYDIYETTTAGGTYKNLTGVKGYDAEGSYSPDGKLIAFASNRHAYAAKLSDREKELLEKDPSYFMEIYVMNADGTGVKRLTSHNGYDGGPFFSPDGKRLVWRRFSEDGATAEVHTMNLDGTDVRQVTRLGAMSWAPYFHPSGEYIIFGTNLQGFANFELYMVDAQGKGDPVRVTHTDGFDSLPVFSPDGKRLSWTSSRTADKKAQIFIADWNHTAAREALTARTAEAAPVTSTTKTPGTSADVRAADLMQHIRALSSDEMDGRLTGTPGEQRATQYVADVFQSLGLQPVGDNGTFFQSFPFTAGLNPGPGNKLVVTGRDGKARELAMHKDWRPLAFSVTGNIPVSDVVFAGYGISAPAAEGMEEYDSYVHLDVKDKWVVVLRYMPESLTPEQRLHVGRYAPLRHKAMLARDKGARGIIVVSGPNAKVKEQLVPLAFDAAMAGSSIAAISITDEVANTLLAGTGKSLKQWQDELDVGNPVAGVVLSGVKVGAQVDLQQEKRTGRNVLARLNAGATPGKNVLIIGAHVDHLGRGIGNNSLAREDEKGGIHRGADDNASGVAGLLEIAEWLTRLKAEGKLTLKRDVLFAAWSGEELGLLGSSHFTKTFNGAQREPETLRPDVYAYLNMDMIGRLDKALVLQGVGSSSVWPKEIEQRNIPVGLSITTQNDSYLPTDATSFYLKGVPILAAFTGAHSEYHTPRDTHDRINADGAEKVVKLMGLIARSLATREGEIDYVRMEKPASMNRRGGLRVYLGTIPDYAQGDIKGVKISGVAKGGPAEKAGLQGGDVIVELAGKKIENVYDYTYALEALKVGQPVEIVVTRSGQRVPLTVTPGTRE
ncbi:MAG: M28 family peptidase [Myxococcota bacterium]